MVVPSKCCFRLVARASPKFYKSRIRIKNASLFEPKRGTYRQSSMASKWPHITCSHPSCAFRWRILRAYNWLCPHRVSWCGQAAIIGLLLLMSNWTIRRRPTMCSNKLILQHAIKKPGFVVRYPLNRQPIQWNKHFPIYSIFFLFFRLPSFEEKKFIQANPPKGKKEDDSQNFPFGLSVPP